MSNYISRAEIEEISDGLIKVYTKNKRIKNVDIEDFITSFLKLKITYANFAEDDMGKIGFLANGKTPILIKSREKIYPYIFNEKTVVIDKFLLSEKEIGRRRFTLAHEAAHYILGRVNPSFGSANFHCEFDKERSYTKAELIKIFTSAEWQADKMAAALLMPKFVVEPTLRDYAKTATINIYGNTTFAKKDKITIKKIADSLGVSSTAFIIRLKELNLLNYKDITEYVTEELRL